MQRPSTPRSRIRIPVAALLLTSSSARAADDTLTLTGLLLAALFLAVGLGLAILALRTRLARYRSGLQALRQTLERWSRGDLGVNPDASLPMELESLEPALDQLRLGLVTTTSARDYLNQVLFSISDAIFLTRLDGTVAQMNPAAERLTGQTQAELRGQPIQNILVDSQRGTFILADARGRARDTALRTNTGDEVPVSYSCAEIAAADPALRGYVITARNIRERKMAEQRIRYLARIDALTKVPNRMQFQHLLQRAIARARRGQHRLALIYLDVDKFKEINDTFGHTAGDLCLEALTDRLQGLLPESSVVGRLAGDEFGVILDNLDPARNLRAEVVATTRLLQETIADPLQFQGHQIYM
ncbi:MAG: diguanylate cyclase, partial [Gammaproteobacteria bacterium]|nr:diguanylate cyclase [Gammaproteobacteria bacterium]